MEMNIFIANPTYKQWGVEIEHLFPNLGKYWSLCFDSSAALKYPLNIFAIPWGHQKVRIPEFTEQLNRQ